MGTLINCKWNLCILFIALSVRLALSSSVNLNPDGGYDIVISIDPEIREDIIDSTEAYLHNIRISMERFSELLHESTKGMFFVNSVKVVVPPDWVLDESYQNKTPWNNSAAIKIRYGISQPLVDNPNICGMPGNNIELPFDFFDDFHNGQNYGPSEKALLKLWARFRYGVWEEHGYIGDLQRFPYFYEQHPSQYKVSGCNDKDLRGVYQTKEGFPCNEYGKPDDDCRFYPSYGKGPSSSVMGFQFVNSINTFCDQTTHTPRIPTKQNVFCNNLSILEVIQRSPDRLRVHTSITVAPRVTFEVVQQYKSVDTPLLYILTDKGLVDAEDTGLAVTFVTSLWQYLIELNYTGEAWCSIGGMYQDRSSRFQDIIEWIPLASLLDEPKLLEEALSINYEYGSRNFGQAILGVAEKLNQINHPAGAVILVLKYGFDYVENPEFPPSLSTVPYEEEIMASLLKSNIVLRAIELGRAAESYNLERLASSTGGHSMYIFDEESIEDQLGSFMNETIELLNIPVQSKTSKLFFKGTQKSPMSISLPATNGMKYRISFTHEQELLDKIIINEQEFDPNYGDFTWEWARSGRAVFILSNFTLDSTTAALNIQFFCRDDPNCSVFVVIMASVPWDDDDVQITVSSSERMYPLPFLENETPAAIYAKIEYAKRAPNNGRFITENAKVTAEIRSANDESVVEIIPLYDNGIGAPDVFSGDGIYSGYIVSNVGDYYKVSVLVQYDEYALDDDDDYRRVHGNLISVDQENVGESCYENYCKSVSLPQAFSKTVDMNDYILLEYEYEEYLPPRPIYDLRARIELYEDEDVEYSEVWLTFTRPIVVGTVDLDLNAFDIKYVVEGTLNGEIISTDCSQIDSEFPLDPGYEFRFAVENCIPIRSGKWEFRVKSVMYCATDGDWECEWGLESDWSNYAQIFLGGEEIIPSSTTSLITEIMEDDNTTTTEILTTDSSSSTATTTITTDPNLTTTNSTTTTTDPNSATTTTDPNSTTTTTDPNSTTTTTDPNSTTTSSTTTTTDPNSTTTSSTTTTTDPNSTTTSSTTTTDPNSTTTSSTTTEKPTTTSTTTTKRTYPPLITPTTEKPWIKTAGGITVITLMVLMFVGVIVGGMFWYWRYGRNYRNFENDNDDVSIVGREEINGRDEPF